MSDIVNDLLRLGEDPNADSKSRRRQVMQRLVQTLIAMADVCGGPKGAQHHQAIIHLTTIIRNMTEAIAEADDATFSAIVREAALLIRSFRQRQAAGLTLH